MLAFAAMLICLESYVKKDNFLFYWGFFKQRSI